MPHLSLGVYLKLTLTCSHSSFVSPVPAGSELYILSLYLAVLYLVLWCLLIDKMFVIFTSLVPSSFPLYGVTRRLITDRWSMVCVRGLCMWSVYVVFVCGLCMWTV